VTDWWHQVGVLFDRALAMPAAERAQWVRASGEPADIQREVLSLLEAHDRTGGFLEQTALDGELAGSPAGARGPGPATPLEPNPLAEGTIVGPYRIARVLGQGGMGVVYEAEDTRLRRRVALKSLPARLSGNERLRLRLRQEARAAAVLTHPSIATVYALEELDEGVFIASEYVEGLTLRAELERGPFTMDRAVATARDIARALAAAHERGIVHRDLKPENVMRTADGGVKLLDFGLAQFDAPAQDLVSWSRLTEPGLVAGTPPYMAPEQLLGGATDSRTDQFSLGVMLYEMTCGRHPFGGSSLPSVIARILAGRPEPPLDRLAVPDNVWAVIDRCLRKEPAERFANTTELTKALDAILEARSSEGRSTQHAARSAPRSERSTLHPALSVQYSALWWWQFHQLAAALLYWLMIWPAWHVHRWIGRGGLLFFLLTLASVIVAANLRLHLWFSSRIYPDELAQQRREVGTWIRWADWAFAAALAAGGISLGDNRAGWAVLLIAFAVGCVVAFLVIEPATARAAFGRDADSRQGSVP
jgi:serine/threonine protein kinase